MSENYDNESENENENYNEGVFDTSEYDASVFG